MLLFREEIYALLRGLRKFEQRPIVLHWTKKKRHCLHKGEHNGLSHQKNNGFVQKRLRIGDDVVAIATEPSIWATFVRRQNNTLDLSRVNELDLESNRFGLAGLGPP